MSNPYVADRWLVGSNTGEQTLEKEYEYISYCGKYYCASCDYYKGTIAKAAKNLLAFAERYGSLRVMANVYNTCNFDEFLKGLRWLAAQETACKGCRFGGGWSWWPDCPVRDCCIEKNVDFCYQCNDFPCKKLKEAPDKEFKKTIIEANNQMKTAGIENHMQQLKKKYEQWQLPEL